MCTRQRVRCDEPSGCAGQRKLKRIILLKSEVLHPILQDTLLEATAFSYCAKKRQFFPASGKPGGAGETIDCENGNIVNLILLLTCV